MRTTTAALAFLALAVAAPAQEKPREGTAPAPAVEPDEAGEARETPRPKIRVLQHPYDISSFYRAGESPLGPWAGLWLAMLVCMLLGAVIGFLAFRFGISGVYFALLTIAFAEFTRIGFDHLAWTGGPGGMFLKVAQRDQIDLVHFRGPPVMYYYAMLTFAAGALALCAWLLKSRAGYYWQAIREDEEAAQALGINIFRWKMLAMILSSAMTAVAGVFFAFYYNNLFPEQIFNISRSIEIILGPIIGGVGTLFGPILGAAVLTVLSDAITELLAHYGFEIPGIKQVFYGLVLLVVIVFLPHGIWPVVARRLGIDR